MSQSRRYGSDERDLRRNADDDQRGSEHQRSNDDLAGERQPSEGRADADRAPSECGLHDPNDQSESGEVKPAAKKVREGRFGGGIEQDAVCDANGEPTDNDAARSPPMRGLSQKDRLADPGLDGAASWPPQEPDLMIDAASRDNVITAPPRRRPLSRRKP